MAPNFFQKLVKVASPSSSRDTPRERVSSSSDSVAHSSASSREQQRSRSQSASVVGSPGSSPSSPTTPTQSSVTAGSARRNTLYSGDSRIPSIITTISNGTKNLGRKKSKTRDRSSSRDRSDRRSFESVGTSHSTQPNVTIVPPSPLVHNANLSDSDDDDEENSIHSAQGTAESANTAETSPEPTPTVSKHSSAPASTPTSADPDTPTMSSTLAPGTYQIRKQPSNKSLTNKKGGLPDIATVSSTNTNHSRAATAPEANEHGVVIQRPMVESPTEVKFPAANGASPPPPIPSTNGSNGSMPAVARENTSATLAAPDKGGKRPWRRSTTRKPTGLASAIAASGLAMANPTLSSAQHAQMGPPPPVITPGSSKGSGDSKQPYMSRSPAQSNVSQRSHGKTRSAEMSPRSGKSRKASSNGHRSRRPSDATSFEPDGSSIRPDYYNGLAGDSSDGEGSDSSSDSLGIGEEDIPVTGFAVASNKRNADFHELFPTVPEGDYLIEDYGCALQREILIQGRIYISENHICFHANIFGWITDLSIPIYEITSLEKKMTALFIPNAIQITTRQAKYTFASFLSRDTTFDVIYNIWRLARPEDGASGPSSGRASVEGLPNTGSITGSAVTMANSAVSVAPVVVAVTGPPARKATQCTCGKEGKHYSETAMEMAIPGTPEKIHNLIFASGFIKEFMAVNQKLLDIQISDWAPVTPNSKLLTRNMSYIKPLNGSLGPKQTKCELKDEVAHCDFDNYVSTVTTTRTPDVPSGGVFSVKTRTCIMWAGPISSKVLVTTQVEWTGRSFIKGIIERSAIDGQKVYHGELEKAMRAYIQDHKSEFLPEGIDAAVIAEAPPEAAAGPVIAGIDVVPAADKDINDEQSKRRERERNARGLQWAYDTFDGAWQVGMRSAKGAIELIRDAWDQSTSTTILWFVIVILVISNLWTLLRVSSSHVDAERRIELRKVEDREKWVHTIVTALWEELEAGKRVAAGPGEPVAGPPLAASTLAVPPSAATEQALPPVLQPVGDRQLDSRAWADEVESLSKTLDAVEQRIKVIREGLAALGQISALD